MPQPNLANKNRSLASVGPQCRNPVPSTRAIAIDPLIQASFDPSLGAIGVDAGIGCIDFGASFTRREAQRTDFKTSRRLVPVSEQARRLSHDDLKRRPILRSGDILRPIHVALPPETLHPLACQDRLCLDLASTAPSPDTLLELCGEVVGHARMRFDERCMS